MQQQYFILGAGSNVLPSDKDLNVVFIKLDSEYFKSLSINGNFLTARAGVKLNQLLDFSFRHHLSGMEFLAGVPATTGGAVFSNAGTDKRCIFEYIEKIKGIDVNGNYITLTNNKINSDYRNSGLKDFIVTEVDFRLEKESENNIAKDMYETLTKKKKTQPLNMPSAGCIFKNPKESQLSAGQLIDSAGLKGKRIGDAQISEKHANFIINLNKATFDNVISLIRLIQEKILSGYNIELEPEVIILNEVTRNLI
jgi:UDP-N-acetylmuramate dehydrogenase